MKCTAPVCSCVGERVQYVIVSWPVEEVEERGAALGEVVMVDLPSLPAIHVLHTHADPQSSRQGSDVDVVTLPVHGIYFL